MSVKIVRCSAPQTVSEINYMANFVPESTDKETANRVQNEIRNRFSEHMPQYLSVMNGLAILNTQSLLTNFRVRSRKSYNPKEFSGEIPKELSYLLDREPALREGMELEYHNWRIDYLNKLGKHIKKSPEILKSWEGALMRFFMNRVLYPAEDCLDKSKSNAWLQCLQLEANLSDLYMSLCVDKFGCEAYITGIGNNGRLYTKKPKKLSPAETIGFYSKAHTHMPMLFSFNSELFQDMIPDGAEWTSGVAKRLENLADDKAGQLGMRMIRAGVEGKYFHSSLPHEIIINNAGIKKMTIKDVPPETVYFTTTFSDDNICAGALSAPLPDGSILLHLSSMFADLVNEDCISTFSSYPLIDLAGCIARDMFICEERERYYDIAEKKVTSEKARRSGARDRVTWLPRFKINIAGRSRDQDYVTEQTIKLSPCHVSGHPRRCANPSLGQLELAANLGIQIPPGFTYVREHDREGSEEFRRLYKSRSAMSMLYQATR